MKYKEHAMSDDELVAHLVSSITRNPRRDMSIAIDEILRRMKAAQQAAQQADVCPNSVAGKHHWREDWEDSFCIYCGVRR